MAKNLRSRKIKLVTKHLRQSRVIYFGFVVILTCLISAGVIEIYLRFFVPENEETVLVALSGKVKSRPSTKIKVKGNNSADKPVVDIQPENKSSDVHNEPVENIPVKFKEKDFPVPSLLPQNIEPSSSGSLDFSDPEYNEPSIEDAPKEAASSKNIQPPPLPPPLLPLSLPLMPPAPSSDSLIKVSNIFLSENYSDNGNVEQPALSGPFGTQDDTKISGGNELFNGFIRVNPKSNSSPSFKVYDLKYFNYEKEKYSSVKNSLDLIQLAVPFTFSTPKNCKYVRAYYTFIENSINLILKSPLLDSSGFRDKLATWLESIPENFTGQNVEAEETKLNEFLDFWKQVCSFIQAHPLYPPFIKSIKPSSSCTPLMGHYTNLEGFDFIDKNLLTDLPLLQPITHEYLEESNNLQFLSGTIAHLILVIKNLEAHDHLPSYVDLLRKFDACHIKEESNELFEPVICLNLHIHYYNELVTQLKPHSKTKTTIKAINNTNSTT